MEGWFWRFTDVANDRVALALCGINRHPDGDWATVAVAAHPGDVVRSAVVADAWASSERFEVRAGDVLAADDHTLRVDLEDVHLRADLTAATMWPLRLGAGGVFASLPYLGQYWHAHILGGPMTGSLTLGDQMWSLDSAVPYAEKNWGAGFPDWWWWGQSQGFGDPSLCVAFGGGRLRAGPIAASVTGLVLHTADGVVRFAPPFARVQSFVGDGSWHVVARRRGWRIVVDGSSGGNHPSVLPVPLPSERRNVDRDFEHLAGHVRLRVWRNGQPYIDDESHLGALEVGSTDLDQARQMADELDVARQAVT